MFGFLPWFAVVAYFRMWASVSLGEPMKYKPAATFEEWLSECAALLPYSNTAPEVYAWDETNIDDWQALRDAGFLPLDAVARMFATVH
jgi:hypothetical protein